MERTGVQRSLGFYPSRFTLHPSLEMYREFPKKNRPPAPSWIIMLFMRQDKIGLCDLAIRCWGKYIKDTQSGFRVYKRDVLNTLTINTQGYEVETELLVKILRRDLAVKEIPITFNRRCSGSSNLRCFLDGFKILRTILKASFC